MSSPRNKGYNTEIFKKLAKKKHGDAYGYDKVLYKGSKQKIKIYCNNCKNYFLQAPVLHLRGHGCRCHQIGRESGKKFTTEEFVKKAKAVHGDNFDYKETKYINARTKVKIFCNNCKNFVYTVPDSHINKKSGCIKCFNIRTGDRCRSSAKEFVKKAKKIHGNKYDYSLVEYINAKTKVIIKCKNCNSIFTQLPSNHIGLSNMNGCPFCQSSSSEKLISEWLKNNKISFKKEKTFDTCVNSETGYKLRFDFFIKPNILIEYNGKQHYEEVKFFSVNQERFFQSKKRDEFKLLWAKKNGFELYVIKYNQNIIKRLEDIFK